ncbi:MoaD/ThiS family protein [Kineococcus glutinatus]|uniref:MoaD/ThiS family protein n=1 Tax=Kineococcus glutinatus TaxID=1070872 RepID=UPI0031E6E15B
MLVRYYAAAAEAAGAEEERLDLPAPLPLARLVEDLGRRHGPDLARVLGACSFLLDATSAEGAAVVADGATLDVLPPFAGG